MLLILCLPVVLSAQGVKAPRTKQVPLVKNENFDSYLHAKCDLVVHELGLNPVDSAKFIVIYHELQQEKSALYQKYGGGRKVRLALASGQTVADTTIMRVLHNNAQLQVEDALLEQRYLARFLGVLTPIQLYKLQLAEQKFKTDVVKRGKPERK